MYLWSHVKFCFQLSGSEDINSTVRQFFCTNKTYNDMATLFFNPQEAAIHQLFHQEGETSLTLHSSSAMVKANNSPIFSCFVSSLWIKSVNVIIIRGHYN